MRKLFIVILLLVTATCYGLDQSTRANLVLFLADDCTYRDIGCYGSSDFKTPAIDQLAADGMRFTKCYQSSAMCSPTRHNLFNGMYPVRTGAYPNHTFVKDSVKSLPHYLQAAG